MKMVMRRLLTAIICTAMVIASVAVRAEGVTAVLSPQKIYVDGQQVEMLAYSINDNNYIRLREIGKAINCSIFYDASMNSVRIDRSARYIGSDTEVLPSPGENVTAILSEQKIFVNGNPVQMTAYSISDNNFVKLRDFGGATNLGMAYDPLADAVYIDTKTAYQPNFPPDRPRPEAIPNQTETTPAPDSGKTLITEKVLDGSEWAREDFSQQANPAVFDSVFTRAAYNAIRQSIVDRDTILADNNADGYNLYYRYANFIDQKYSPSGVPGETYSAMHKVLDGKINNYFRYELSIEPYVKNRYAYPGYRMCKAVTHEFFAPANQATDGFINDLKSLSDREKIKRINDYVCEKLDYNANSIANPNKIFASDEPAFGACGAYANAIHYLCQRADIPCVDVTSETHGWNEVFIDGRWYVLDATANDIDPPKYNIIYLVDKHPTYSDLYPKHTAFAKELLKPGGTK